MLRGFGVRRAYGIRAVADQRLPAAAVGRVPGDGFRAGGQAGKFGRDSGLLEQLAYQSIVVGVLRVWRDTGPGGSATIPHARAYVDDRMQARLGGCPARPLREALGVRVEEYRPLGHGELMRVSDGSWVTGRSGTAVHQERRDARHLHGRHARR